MAYTKISLLDRAYEIVKAYAAGGGKDPLDEVLKLVYEELVRLNEGLEK